MCMCLCICVSDASTWWSRRGNRLVPTTTRNCFGSSTLLPERNEVGVRMQVSDWLRMRMEVSDWLGVRMEVSDWLGGGYA